MAAISVLLASGLLAGCGGGGHSTTAASKSSSAASKGSSAASKGSASASRARAFARAVNLRASDLPGLRASSEHHHETPAEEKRRERELLHCVGSGGSSSTGTSPGLVEASSKNYERNAGLASVSVSSEVSVARTTAVAAGELQAFHSSRVRGCLSHFFDALLESQNIHGASVGPVSTKQGSPPAPGMTGSFGLRFTAAITLRGVHVPFYLDILGFVDGPARVSLSTFGLPRPFPASAEEQLFSLLLRRAKANKV